MGQPAWIAERTGCPVVSDLRSRDIAAGGQGAPLVGLFDVLWLRSRPGRPVALNLGGIANITVDLGTDRPLAYDTGPANALLDAAIRSVTGERNDRDGARAARGTIQPELLDRLLAEPYYGQGAPKSTGKELFNLDYLRGFVPDLGPESLDDVLATLTELTARSVADAIGRHDPTEVIVAGGGLATRSWPVGWPRPWGRCHWSRPRSSGWPVRPRRRTCSRCSASSPRTVCPARHRPPPEPGTRRCSARSPPAAARCGPCPTRGRRNL